MTDDSWTPEIAPWGTPYPQDFHPISEDPAWSENQRPRLPERDLPEDSDAPLAHVVIVDIAQQRSDMLDVLDGVIACLEVVNGALETVVPHRKHRRKISLFHCILGVLGLG
jgi:hypothetical protein